METWRSVTYDNDYEVSDFGHVRCVGYTTKHGHWRKPQMMKLIDDGRGYRMVSIKGKLAFVHKLVLEAFIGPRPQAGMHIAHWDGDGTNNRLSNLRYDTASGNHADKIRHGTDNRGAKHPNSKLTDADVLAIITLCGDYTRTEIAKAFKVSIGNISLIANGKAWQHLQ